jgi:hypothetical protein
MSNLSYAEKNKLEKLFGMGGGYVLDFSNRTFQEFVFDSVGRDIKDPKYARASGSKANRLRAFWEREPNHVVGKVLKDLLELCSRSDDQMFEACRRIAERLSQDAPVLEIEALSPNSGGRDFETLAKSVRECIEKNEPEVGLDRLHTFVLKYVRVLCQKHGVAIDREKPLHSLFGEYVKKLKPAGRLESTMTERILKSSISVLEAFNDVRNEQSLAHDNPVLNYDESLLIFNHVSSSIRFIASIEESPKQQPANVAVEDDDEVPF